MELVLTGEIKSSSYDKVLDLDRVEFSDKKNNMEVYFEFPRLEGSASLDDNKTITIKITDDTKKTGTEETKMVLNTTLYMIREDENKKNVVQFSSGGIILRLISNKKKHPFKLRGTKSFKIFIS